MARLVNKVDGLLLVVGVVVLAVAAVAGQAAKTTANLVAQALEAAAVDVYSPAQAAQAVTAAAELAEVQMQVEPPQLGAVLAAEDGVHQAAALTIVVLLAVWLSH